MRILEACNPDQGLAQALQQVLLHGIPMDSRNGPVLRFPTPVTTVWTNPLQRVSFNPIRDANPFLHLMEAMWMLAGNNDIATVGFYAKQMLAYSDDGETQNAAYGYRWRKHFGHDQLNEVVQILKKDPNSRQAVVQIWDHEDLTKSTKDKACNLIALFEILRDRVNMTVYNRSNDIVWGCYGANVVHFSFLHEYVANRVGFPVGTYYQVSNNLHLYTEFDITKRFVEKGGDGQYQLTSEYAASADIYHSSVVSHPLGADYPNFEEAVQTLVGHYDQCEHIGFNDVPWFRYVAEPMRHSYALWKSGDRAAAYNRILEAKVAFNAAYQCENDWLLAARLWMERRLNKDIKNT